MSSYTTAYKDYPAETFEAAVAAMLSDPDVFDQRHGSGEETRGTAGEYKGYAVESWEWNVATGSSTGVLTVHFK